MNSTYASSSLVPLPVDIRHGMISMGIIGLLSTSSTLSLLAFITYRMVYWRKYYERPIHTNQVFILIYNLLLADFQQALSFIIAFHWVSMNELIGPTTACFAQAWLIQIGDVSSGLFVLSIAVHTFISLVRQKTIPMKIFILAVVSVWIFCLLLTLLGPSLNPKDFFVPAGAWCWINQSHQWDRLFLHYLWIFISQLGSLLIYITIFAHLHIRTKSTISNNAVNQNSNVSNNNPTNDISKGATTTIVTAVRDPFAASHQRILRTARIMVIYPFAYVSLTLPLAAARVATMAGKEPPLGFFPVAGSLMASCGFVDVILYLWTRKALLKTNVGMKQSSHDNHHLSTIRYGMPKRAEFPQTDGPGNRDEEQGSGRNEVPGRKGTIVVLKSVTTSRSESSRRGSKEDSDRPLTADSRRSLVLREKGVIPKMLV